MIRKHRFHLVDRSPWPAIISLFSLGLTSSLVAIFHNVTEGKYLFIFFFIFILVIMVLWFRDIIREGTLLGYHTKIVQRSLRLGFLFFIVSEVMFFFSFFWGYFHSSLCPSIEIGDVWPPVGIEPFSPWSIPLLNTAILLLSGASVTWAHHGLLANKPNAAVNGLIVTVLLGIIFTGLQFMEYVEAWFTITDGIYGSTFFLTTGFHGLHVIIGTLFLVVCLFRAFFGHFTSKHHIGFEAAAWYWHFVDVVWLFLFISIYWWGGMMYYGPVINIESGIFDDISNIPVIKEVNI